jgi:radical SAM protein with 4Fe4S-binding SPASM domain
MVDGKIFCCAKDKAPDLFNFGRFNFENNTVELDNDKLNKIRNLNILNYEECFDCFCKYHCSGDCPDRRLTDSLNCEAIRKIGIHVLNSKIKS